MPAFDKTNQGLSGSLQSGEVGIHNQFFEHLDLLRKTGPEYMQYLSGLLRSRYSQRKIDFIITLYPEGLKFLLDQGRGIFADAPVLTLYLPQGFELRQTGRRVIPHVVITDHKRTMEIALKLVPNVKRVYVVSGTHPVDKLHGPHYG